MTCKAEMINYNRSILLGLLGLLVIGLLLGYLHQTCQHKSAAVIVTPQLTSTTLTQPSALTTDNRAFAGAAPVTYSESKISGAPYDALIATILEDIPDEVRRKSVELELKEDRDKFLAMLKEPTPDGKCNDPKFPFLNKEINKCVQCFTDSYNCLTGWQKCHYGTCNIKPSPACSIYPSLLTGLATIY